jgi:predicted transposase/invertase (TIGR01784 family)
MHASEVMNMLFTEFNMDDAKEIWFEEGFETGMEKGMEKGVAKGMAKGMEQNRKDTARSALAKGLSVTDVADITGLDEETVRKLKAGAAM